MTASDLIYCARNAQRLTGKASALVCFVVPGQFRGPGKKIRLAGKHGPTGKTIKGMSYGVLATFKANGVLRYANAGAVAKPNKRKWSVTT